MTHTERAELRALAQLLTEKWPTTQEHVGAIGFSGDKCAVLDATNKDYALYVFEPVTL